MYIQDVYVFCFGVEIGSGSGISEEDGIAHVCIVDIKGIVGSIAIQDTKNMIVDCAANAAVASLNIILASSSDSVVSLPVSMLLFGIG